MATHSNREIAHMNYRQYIAADFEYMMGRGKKPEPSAYGYSGDNQMNINGETFHVCDLFPGTFPVHAGF